MHGIKATLLRPICAKGLLSAVLDKQTHEIISERLRAAISTAVHRHILESGQKDKSHGDVHAPCKHSTNSI